MNQPAALIQLLEELAGEHISSDVQVTKTSEAAIYVDDDAVADDDPVRVNSSECRLLFANPQTAERLVETINNEDATLALFDVTVSTEVLDVLERGFAAVDEG